jgi:uncharacterized protein YfaS (alpha-2-macroglobulin family)
VKTGDAPTTASPLVVMGGVGESAHQVAGDVRWLGRHAVAFIPKSGRFASGRFTARLVDDLTSLSGQKLSDARAWAFEVPLSMSGRIARPKAIVIRRDATVARAPAIRPIVVRKITPGSGAVRISRTSNIDVWFANYVLPADLKDRIKLRAKAPGATEPVDIAFKVDASRYRRAFIRPDKPFPVGASVEVEIAERHTSASGVPIYEQAKRATFRVAEAFEFDAIGCEADCAPSQGLTLKFTERVTPRDVWKALKVTPGARINEPSTNEPDREVTLHGAFRPKTKYTVAIAGALKSADGTTIKAPARVAFETRGYREAVHFAVEGSLVERKGLTGVPVVYQSVPAGFAHVLPIAEGEIVPRLTSGASGNLATGLTPTHSFPFKKWEGARYVMLVDPAKQLPPGGGGVVEILAGSGKKSDATKDRLLVNVTDLGVTTKRSPFGVTAWVTSLASGAPVEGARIVVRNGANKVLWEGATDTHGLAFAPREKVAPKGQDRAEKLWVFAAKESDLAYVATNENQWMMMPSSFDIPDATGQSEGEGDEGGQTVSDRTTGIIFTDRGVYRPGEKVRLKGIARRAGLKTMETPEGAAVKLTIKDERGNDVETQGAKLSAFGSFAFDVALPQSATLGRYEIKAEIGDAEPKGAVSESFRVEEFKTPDFAVKATTDKRDVFAGDAFRWNAEARYLFGAPMRGAKMEVTITRRQTSFTPPKHAGFYFGEESAWWTESGDGAQGESRSTVVLSRNEVTDEAGTMSGELVVEPPAKGGLKPMNYVVEATATGLTQEEISARTAVTAHPADYYLGVLAEWTFLESTETFRADLAAVRPDGSRIAGLPLLGEVFKRTWTSYRRENEGGTGSYGSRVVDKLVHTCRATSSEGLARCDFKPREGGSYFFVARGKDSKGRALKTSLGFYVLGPTTTAWAASDEVKIGLIADKQTYAVGDTARFIVKSPFPRAHALVTVEREGVIYQEHKLLEGTAPAIRLRVTEEFLPNAFVSVALVRGRAPGAFTPTGDDPRRPLFRIGYATIRVDPKEKRVRVAVTPDSEEKRPGDEVTVRLRTTDQRGGGVPTEMTVYVVDEGVLSLTAYKTPDPIKALYATRGLAVMTSDNRYRAMRRRAYQEKGDEPAGGGGGKSGLRSKFEATTYFNPSVLTDGDGNAEVKFKLPDNLTTFRVMAVAATKGAEFGSGDAKFRVAKPLVMLPSVPRFVRAGDRFEAGVVVHNHTSAAEKAVVGFTGTGITVAGPASQEVELLAGRGTTVRFPLIAGSPGAAVLRFRGKMGDHTDGVEVTREIKIPSSVETLAWGGIADSSAKQMVAIPRDARDDVGELTVSFAASERVELTDGLAYLIHYPYGCAEQTTSTLAPLLGLRDLTEGLNIAKAKDIPKMVKHGVSRLYKFQHDNGGFSLWGPGGDDSSDYGSKPEPWLSAWVLWTLAEAERQGYDVDKGVKNLGASYLAASLKERMRIAGVAPAAAELAEKAQVAYVVAALGKPVPSIVSFFYDRRADLPVYAKAFLAHAMHLAGRDTARVAALVADIARAARPVDNGVRFADAPTKEMWRLRHTDVRTNAIVLSALTAIAPEHPLTAKIARGLLDAREDGHWLHTQENAYALLGLSEYFKGKEKSAQLDVTAKIGDRVIHEGPAPGGSKPFWSATLPFGALLSPSVNSIPVMAGTVDNPLAFVVKSRSGDAVRYRARLRFAPRTQPADVRDDGITVWKTIERLGDRSPTKGQGVALFAPSATQANAGELLRVNLTIVVPKARRDVVVDDPLPAGAEAVNFNLATTRRGGREGKDNASRWTHFTHRENRADRVVLFAPHMSAGIHRYRYLARATVPGTYVVPATHAEEMYDPRVNGRGRAQVLAVKAE